MFINKFQESTTYDVEYENNSYSVTIDTNINTNSNN